MRIEWSISGRRVAARGSQVAVARDGRPYIVECALLKDRYQMCTMASDHCGLLGVPREVPTRYRLQWKSYEFFVEKLALE